MKYHVGQIIYAILNKKGQVYPMRVIEEITKKTLKGEEVNYVLQAGKDQSVTILLNDVEGEIFTTAEEARSILVDRATRQIEKIIVTALAKAKEWYPPQGTDLDEVHELPSPYEKSEQTVTLSDGTVARFKLGD
jgi:hypothetical protein